MTDKIHRREPVSPPKHQEQTLANRIRSAASAFDMMPITSPVEALAKPVIESAVSDVATIADPRATSRDRTLAVADFASDLISGEAAPEKLAAETLLKDGAEDILKAPPAKRFAVKAIKFAQEHLHPKHYVRGAVSHVTDVYRELLEHLRTPEGRVKLLLTQAQKQLGGMARGTIIGATGVAIYSHFQHQSEEPALEYTTNDVMHPINNGYSAKGRIAIIPDGFNLRQMLADGTQRTYDLNQLVKYAANATQFNKELLKAIGGNEPFALTFSNGHFYGTAIKTRGHAQERTR